MAPNMTDPGFDPLPSMPDYVENSTHPLMWLLVLIILIPALILGYCYMKRTCNSHDFELTIRHETPNMNIANQTSHL